MLCGVLWSEAENYSISRDSRAIASGPFPIIARPEDPLAPSRWPVDEPAARCLHRLAVHPGFARHRSRQRTDRRRDLRRQRRDRRLQRRLPHFPTCCAGCSPRGRSRRPSCPFSARRAAGRRRGDARSDRRRGHGADLGGRRDQHCGHGRGAARGLADGVGACRLRRRGRDDAGDVPLHRLHVPGRAVRAASSTPGSGSPFRPRRRCS